MTVYLSEGQSLLINEVIKKGICVKCGACVGFCPYFDYHDGKVVALDLCCSDTARCYQICPVADNKDQDLERKTDLGNYIKVITARAADSEIIKKAQYGGTVSALIICALKRGLIKSALLTDAGDNFFPEGLIAKKGSEVLKCAGSRYTGSASLSAFNRAAKEGEEMIGIVGLSCQMKAVSLMKFLEPDTDNFFNKVALKIGLFCTWALDYRRLSDFLHNNEIKEKPVKYDIPPPPSEIFRVETKKRIIDFPLSDIRPFIQKGCLLCGDMTAEYADISIGTVEGRESWNTVIVRTQRGSDLFDAAVENGYIETGVLPEENLNHLMEASRNKRLKKQS